MDRIQSFLRVLVVAAVAATVPVAAWANGNANGSQNQSRTSVLEVPTLGGVGLAALAGGLVMTGTYLVMRRGGKKTR